MTDEIKSAVLQEFGFNDGLRIAGVVLPNIIKDFEGVLGNSLVGSLVSEEYKFDDRDGFIALYGIRNVNGSEIVGAKIAASRNSKARLVGKVNG